MLTIFDGHRAINRRKMLTIGSLGFGGLSLSSLLGVRRAAGNTASSVTGKSVIFLFQQGGPSQLETFDPKPYAPEAVRTVGETIQTSLPGVAFGEHMSRLAELAHKLTIVRSFQTGNNGHNLQPLVGPDSLETNIGVHYSRVVGSTRRSTGMPTNSVLFPSAVDTDVPRPSPRGNISATGSYSAAYAPFIPGADGQLQQDMQLNLPQERFFNDRRQLLDQLDLLNRQIDATGQIGAMDELQQQAFEVLLGGGVTKALDLSLEDPETVARYDTSHFAQPGRWDKANRGKRGLYTAHAKSIGKLLLLARRLCEAGCGFVTIHAGYVGTWDMHADGNNLNMQDGMQAIGPAFDHAVAAFVEDLEARGLQDQILLAATGEMGRTPRLNKGGGRDHWGRLAPLLMYGGGIPEGQVIGQSSRDAGEPITENFTPKHLIASMMHTVFNVGELRLVPGVPNEVLSVSDTEPITGLF